jgi:shikimate kinase
MKLIFLYGPPASGKLTVAELLSKRTGITLFHNHMVHDMLKVLFPFENEELTHTRSHLARKFRLEIIEEAAKNNVSFITTFGQTQRDYKEYFRAVKKAVEDNNGEVVFIQLLPTKEALLDRVESPSRIGKKLDSKDIYSQLLEEHSGFMDSYPDIEHLRIDNSNLSPEEVCDIITEELSI